MKIRFWQSPRNPARTGVESRFPPGTRSGEGSESVRVFVEAARQSRVEALPPPPDPTDSPPSNTATKAGEGTRPCAAGTGRRPR